MLELVIMLLLNLQKHRGQKCTFECFFGDIANQDHQEADQCESQSVLEGSQPLLSHFISSHHSGPLSVFNKRITLEQRGQGHIYFYIAKRELKLIRKKYFYPFLPLFSLLKLELKSFPSYVLAQIL